MSSKEEMSPLNDTWLSGKPYYCALCGLGMGEYLACEEPDCALETPEAAQERLRVASIRDHPIKELGTRALKEFVK